jgi:tRNA nucleotidyltransferase (CCA-adding enzyme)
MLSDSKLEIWFTGGWIRDKLIGIKSSDIDVALSTMTGMHLGKVLREFYLSNEGVYSREAAKLGVPAKFKGLHRVDRKPDKSKHFETCTTQIFGLGVDFVNLREESYTEDYRNPQMVFGTAEADAFRRDATINAIFYNLE